MGYVINKARKTKNLCQGWEKEKTKGRMITKGGKKQKTQGLVKTREGIPSPVLIVSSSTIEKIYELTLFTKIGTKSALFHEIFVKLQPIFV